MSTKPGSDPTAGPDSSSAGRLRRWPDRLALLPLNLLLASVLVLAGYTTWVNFRVEAERDVSEKVLVPALRAAQDLMIHAALELEGLYQYTLTGDPVALSDYHESMHGRRAATAALEPLAQGLHGTARQHSDTLMDLANRWNAAAPDPASLSQLEPAAREEYLRHVQVLYRAIIVQTAVLQDQLRVDIDASRAEVAAAERLVWYFTLGLAALALTAALLVRWLVRRVRGLAVVSEHRRQEAEAAMDHRSRLLRGITHDVKNPLGAADGSAQLLEMGVAGGLTDGQQEIVGRIRRGIGASLRIISDLLDLSRTEAGGLEIELAPSDVTEVLGEAAEDHRSSAEAEGLTMELDIPDTLPCVLADRDRVRQVVSNLLSNAVKYTPEGGRVTLTAGARGGTATPLDTESLAISVADTGPGIPLDEQEQIFEEFYRSRALTERTAGIGLGLSISRRIARLLNGDLTVESEPGKGAVFTLWLPIEQEAQWPDQAA